MRLESFQDEGACGCPPYEHNEVKVQLWDTPGKYWYRDHTLRYIKDADVIIFVYDITSKKTFKQIENFMKIVEKTRAYPELVLVGNKIDCDRKEENKLEKASNRKLRQVSFEDGLKYAMKHKMSFYELSAKDDINISNLFESLITQSINEIS